jgi:hypothetical protein
MILRSDLAHVAEYASRATQMRGKTAAVREILVSPKLARQHLSPDLSGLIIVR